MIGKLKGILSYIDRNNCLIDTVGGVSYELYTTPSFLLKNKVGDVVEIITYLQVKDDGLVLFGFENKDDHSFFKMLLTVSGVGPKTAFNIISSSKTEEIIKGIKENNVSVFSGILGLGKKTALKIILELSGKLNARYELPNDVVSDDNKTVIAALTSLGFTPQEARTVLPKIQNDQSVEKRISQAIKLLTARKL